MKSEMTQEDCEKAREALIGVKVKFPEKPDNANEIGTIKDVYFQPAVSLDELERNDSGLPMIYESEDERPYPYDEYPYGLTQLKAKMLCVIQFSDCVHITELQDLILETS